MPPRSKQQTFAIMMRALALAEERNGVALGHAAADVGIKPAELRRLLEPVLYLEFRTPDGDIVHAEHNYLLTEDDHLVVTEDNWLRTLSARPPAPETSLRLLIAGTL